MSGLPLSLLAVSHLYLHRLSKLVYVDFQYKPAKSNLVFFILLVQCKGLSHLVITSHHVVYTWSIKGNKSNVC